MFVEGYVGTIETETRGTDRIWFGLTTVADKAEWIRSARPGVVLAEPGVGRTSTVSRLHPDPDGGDALGPAGVGEPPGRIPDFHKSVPGDAFGVDGVRSLRVGMVF